MKAYAAIVGALLLAGCADDPYATLKSWGYVPLKPASLFTGPGKIYAVETPDGMPWTESSGAHRNLTEICLQDEAFLADLRRESAGPTVDSREKLVAETSISTADLKSIKADAKFSVIRDVRQSITDVKFFSMPDVGIAQVRDRIAQNDKVCAQQVRERLRAGFDVAFSQSVVQVNMTYTVDFDAGVEANAKLALTQEIAPSLAQKFQLVSNDKVVVSGLYMGQRPFYNRPKDSETLTELLVVPSSLASAW